MVHFQSLDDWQTFYLITGVFHLAGVALFDVFCKAMLQPRARNPMAMPGTVCREGDPVDDDCNLVSEREEVMHLLGCEGTTEEAQALSDDGSS